MRTTAQIPSDTADRILDVAERLVQMLGFNGFSYADIAAELKITKASLHYHFATKAELGARLIARYQGRFQAALAASVMATGAGALPPALALAMTWSSSARKPASSTCAPFRYVLQ